ncbi:MAG: sigma-70 family RNA polymerase sigma factor, partial [Bacteroidetes bacterium]|nr:sigma-70 family RNA polymerase sigma factor [Bacteroidota bacterium]
HEHLHRFALSILRSKEDAEEVVSDFFISVWQKRASLLEIENIKLYFFVSIKNISINKLRQKKRATTSFNEDYLVQFKSPFFNPSELLLSKEAVEKILGAINDLPPKCKLIFRLIKEDNLKYAEVAELLNISVKTVESQMAIALKKIGESYNFKIQFPELHSILTGKK